MKLTVKLNLSALKATPPPPKRTRKKAAPKPTTSSIFEQRDLVPAQFLSPDGKITSSRSHFIPEKNHEHVKVGSEPFDPYIRPTLYSRSMEAHARSNLAILKILSHISLAQEFPEGGFDWRDCLFPHPVQLELPFGELK